MKILAGWRRGDPSSDLSRSFRFCHINALILARRHSILKGITFCMGNLTETAFYTRKAINWALIALVLFVIFRLLFFGVVDIIKNAFPTPTLVPDNALGKLPKISFSESASPSGTLTYRFETISGKVPTASEAARVFFMPKNRSNFLSLSDAQTAAGRIGFTGKPVEVTPTLFRWTDPDNSLRTLQVDVVNDHYSLAYSYIHDLNIFSEKGSLTAEKATSEALTLLQTLELMPTDMDTKNPAVQFLALSSNSLVPTTSQSQANAVKVDFHRAALFGIPSVSDSTTGAPISVILSTSSNQERKILSLEYKYWPLDAQTQGVYKLKTSTQAYEELVANNAHFVSIPEDQTQIALTDTYIAYYDSNNPQLFLQPVYVFVGNDGFVAMVPAVASPWIEE